MTVDCWLCRPHQLCHVDEQAPRGLPSAPAPATPDAPDEGEPCAEYKLSTPGDELGDSMDIHGDVPTSTLVNSVKNDECAEPVG